MSGALDGMTAGGWVPVEPPRRDLGACGSCAVLALLVLPCVFGVLSMGMEAGRTRTTYAVAKSQIEHLKAALAMYQTDHGRYPRGEGGLLDDHAPALYRALLAPPGRGGGANAPYLCDWKGEYVGRVDRVSLRPGAMGERGTYVEPLGPAEALPVEAAGGRVPVLLDPWGNPFHYREWASVDRGAKEDLQRSPARRVGFVHRGVPVDGSVADGPHDADRFDIWSNGPNGINEYGAPCSDDVTSWRGDVHTLHTLCLCPELPRRGPSRRLSLSWTGVLGGGAGLTVLGVLLGRGWRRRRRRRPVRVVVAPRPKAPRCAYCHAPARPLAASCCACGAVLHADCWGEAGACPTLGCGPSAASARG